MDEIHTKERGSFVTGQKILILGIYFFAWYVITVVYFLTYSKNGKEAFAKGLIGIPTGLILFLIGYLVI